VTRDFDVIIVGSGPGGSNAADVLTAAGRSVLLFERGRNRLIDLDHPDQLLYEFSNDEIKFMERHFLGPDPWLEPRTFRHGPTDGDRCHVGNVNNLPATVGGGGVHADGKLPRFRQDDFRLHSLLGPVDGASVVDWPFSYEDLEPFYGEAERMVGVSGLAGANPFAAPRVDPYPMPPGAPMYGSLVTVAAAERLGYHPYPGPTGANSVEYDGRPACNNCGFCAFYGCPIHAKGDPVALLRRALLTGRAELRPESFVSRVLVRDGRAYGVEWLDEEGGTHQEHADQVVVAGGAMETARLLLLSGIEHPELGRNLMFHFQTISMGGVEFRTHYHKGRSVSHLHDDHIVPDRESFAVAAEAGLPWIKGGLVEHCGPAHPILEAKLYEWGPGHKESMRESPLRDHLLGFTMQGEDLPQATNTIDLDPDIRDIRGLPVARTTYAPHRHELVASSYHGAKLEAILMEAGAQWSATVTSPMLADNVFGITDVALRIPGSHHVMGTARMGTDPATSVCDPWGRLHQVPNVVIADSSLFPTGTGYGPTLTLVALAIRNARAMVDRGC
jgi:gluconate 2-dehydrogenase alpha chain